MLDPGVSLPTFVTLNIKRLPPVGMEDIDASSVEMCGIRKKIRETANLFLDMCVVKEQLKELLEWKDSIRGVSGTSKAGTEQITDASKKTNVGNDVQVVVQSATDDGSSKEGWSRVVRKNVTVSSSSVIAGNLVNRKPVATKRNEMKNG